MYTIKPSETSVSFLLILIHFFLMYMISWLHNWVSLGKRKSFKMSVFFTPWTVLTVYTMKTRVAPAVAHSGDGILGMALCGLSRPRMWCLLQEQAVPITVGLCRPRSRDTETQRELLPRPAVAHGGHCCWALRSSGDHREAEGQRELRGPPHTRTLTRQGGPGSWGCPATSAGSSGGSAVKNPPVRKEPQETRVWSLGREDPLEEGMATHSSLLGWRITCTEEPGSYSPGGHKDPDTAERLSSSNSSYPCCLLFCSCLDPEN